MAKITNTTFGTKLNVISWIDVAACILPMLQPIAKAAPKKGPLEIST